MRSFQLKTGLLICLSASFSILHAASTILAVVGSPRFLIESIDGGTTWQLVKATAHNPLMPDPSYIDVIAVDPRDPATWYAIGNSGATYGLFKTSDSGQTWSAKAFVGISPFVNVSSLAIDAGINTVYMIARAGNDTDLVSSTDDGTTWTTHHLPFNAYYDQGHFPAGPPVQTIYADPKISGLLYATVDATIFRSTDFGTTWSIVVAGLDTPGANGTNGILASGAPVLVGVQVDPRNSQTIYALTQVLGVPCTHPATGSQCGLYRSLDNGLTWSGLALPASYTSSLGVDPTNGALYASASPGGLGPSILKSVDAGNTWNPIKNAFATPPQLLVDPATPSMVYATDYLGEPQPRFYRSTDGGATWTMPPLPTSCIAGTSPICGGIIVQILQLAIAAPAAGPPAITANGIVNGASFQPGVIANSWMTILGTSLSQQTGDWGQSIVNGKLPISLNSVSVTVGGKPAYVDYISPTQLNVLAPDVPNGPVTVTVTTSKGESAAFSTTASQYGPAFFIWPQNQPVATRPDYSLAVKSGTFAGVTTIAAKPGDVLVLWGTGFGPTSPAIPVGVAVPGDTTYSTMTLPAVTINNTPVTVYGAALAPGSAGLYQIAIQVPSNLADGDWPIQAAIGGTTSPTGVLLSVRH